MRKLKYLVLHCTATPEGREVTSDEIRAWHTGPVSKGGRGWKQVGYTDMIHLDGTVERLVDNNEDANVDNWEITNGLPDIIPCHAMWFMQEVSQRTVRLLKTPVHPNS